MRSIVPSSGVDVDSFFLPSYVRYQFKKKVFFGTSEHALDLNIFWQQICLSLEIIIPVYVGTVNVNYLLTYLKPPTRFLKEQRWWSASDFSDPSASECQDQKPQKPSSCRAVAEWCADGNHNWGILIRDYCWFTTDQVTLLITLSGYEYHRSSNMTKFKVLCEEIMKIAYPTLDEFGGTLTMRHGETAFTSKRKLSHTCNSRNHAESREIVGISVFPQELDFIKNLIHKHINIYI